VDDIQLAAAICKAAEEWDGLHITKTEFENYFYAVAALRAAVAAGKETP
jgi:hypothetical protein